MADAVVQPNIFQTSLAFIKTHLYVLVPVIALVVYFLLPKKNKTRRR
jgi:hypothetical protein